MCVHFVFYVEVCISESTVSAPLSNCVGVKCCYLWYNLLSLQSVPVKTVAGRMTHYTSIPSVSFTIAWWLSISCHSDNIKCICLPGMNRSCFFNAHIRGIVVTKMSRQIICFARKIYMCIFAVIHTNAWWNPLHLFPHPEHPCCLHPHASCIFTQSEGVSMWHNLRHLAFLSPTMTPHGFCFDHSHLQWSSPATSDHSPPVVSLFWSSTVFWSLSHNPLDDPSAA